MSSSIILMIAAMGMVTYIPRMLPFVMLNGRELPPFLQRVLKNIPYAILGALIFPGVLYIQEDIRFGVVGAVSAFVLAYLGANIMVIIIGAIVTLSLFSLFL
ncbi:AzlD domain-containing protein [Peribacillus psychrosaccharolyticus]|jgi:branched-subunit amino acid transport protein|uniref:AzlD domain-containing protein n=1 Tax=Peribacillus psychrosaccharolyticus TaxID=1407 RepID=A0A974S1X0_PERPY|nr:AzlD domain-containing protein [Peribacillus psychrosaccharolyticus]MEC2054970.1 AzlD domain-containing protein [Peribacillus psychrosaccharolyticus]MED3746529.1 AzlD domain-containing protein [Peribacillus psychrosaccharolyticus]QQT02112.1 AzlD domain-containing protein [Peribacillus psychrosaccharolyticus]